MHTVVNVERTRLGGIWLVDLVTEYSLNHPRSFSTTLGEQVRRFEPNRSERLYLLSPPEAVTVMARVRS